eukprot:m.240982 g.240982  ORF g.240982 m.240982 type:complete len:608 (+) comp16083_c2_seq4:85-1908(+)
MILASLLVTVVTANAQDIWGTSNSLHVFMDLTGLSDTQNVYIEQHKPTPLNPPVVTPTKPWDGGDGNGAIAGYCSVVHVSVDDIRIYYDTFGTYGRFLCVAVSKDNGTTWTKPALGLVSFEGDNGTNIILPPNGTDKGFEPGMVFMDDNPDCLPQEKFKAVMSWNGGATMFASADGFKFTPMNMEPLLKGSDTQDVVFYDKMANNNSGAYVYYGRSHLRGGQNITCAQAMGTSSVSEPGRSVNHFVIGKNVTNWPVHSADTPGYTIFNTDTVDPPCIDIYTSVATPLGDAYFLFPMMYNHFTLIQSQGRGNDGLLEARMAVSRNGHNVSYVSREPFYARGMGHNRKNNTGIFEGDFNAASTAVARGMVHLDEKTLMFGFGSQYTHGGYVGFSHQGGPLLSGLQTLELRKHGFVSVSTSKSNIKGTIMSSYFILPKCEGTQLQMDLNVESAIGLGLTVQLWDMKQNLLAVSDLFTGNEVSWAVTWNIPSGNTSKVWVNKGCAYEYPGPADKCGEGDGYMYCNKTSDCLLPGEKIPGTCHGIHVECTGGICAAPNITGGESCGHYETQKQMTPIGSNLLDIPVEVRNNPMMWQIDMYNSKLYTTQFTCN